MLFLLCMDRQKGLTSMETAIEIRKLDEGGFRFAVVIGGFIRFVGSHENCNCFLRSKLPREDRDRQDHMLIRAVH
jgi:hypothetical protein